MRVRPRLTAALALLLLSPGLLSGSSSATVAAPPAEPLAAQLQRATAEARSAEAEVQRLEGAAREAGDEAERLRARQAAAAEAIAAAEARISAGDARLRLVSAVIEARRERLARQQAPAGALLAGLAMMASRPPLLTILDSGSTEEFVRVRLLLDSTLPEIRSRAAALSRELEQGVELQRSAQAARAALVANRETLATRRRAFAALEEQALRLAQAHGVEAIGAGDVALASGEQAAELEGRAARGRAAGALAAELAKLPPAPPRPLPPSGAAMSAPLAYRLPAAARVVDGFGSVSPAGVRSRGIVLGTARGAAVQVPAGGIVRFAGPFRTHDGVVIIDHGRGWMSLITNVGSRLEPGTKVVIGQPLGRALGAIGVELSQDGRRVSPALIAGSSQKLSNRRKDG